MSDQDPTRPQRPVPGPGAGDADRTSAMRTTTETGGRPPVPPGPPRGGGVATGLAVAAALVVGLIGLLAGFLLFGGDDENDAADVPTPEETVAPDTESPDLEAERDELIGQVEDLTAEVEDLQSQLDEVSQERDDLQSQLDDAGDDQIETFPAPDVVGGTLDDAENVAEENGWVLVERTVQAPGGEEPGTVVAQYPDAETPLIDGSVLVVDVVGESDE